VSDGATAGGVQGPRSSWWVARPLLVGVVIALPCLLAFFELAEDFAMSAKVAAFDAAASGVIQGWRSPRLTPFFIGVTTLANAPTVWVVAALVVIALLWFRHRREALLVFLAVAVGSVFGAIAKVDLARQRPPIDNMLIALPAGFSFPSGHALAGVELYGVLAFLAVRQLRAVWAKLLAVAAAVSLALLIGVSRVYLGVHWPSDVLASWLLGGAWLAFLCGAYVSWERHSIARAGG
jgi:undecaprenyl-diphosphatase